MPRHESMAGHFAFGCHRRSAAFGFQELPQTGREFVSAFQEGARGTRERILHFDSDQVTRHGNADRMQPVAGTEFALGAIEQDFDFPLASVKLLPDFLAPVTVGDQNQALQLRGGQ
jgi:hypothetical protein